MSKKSKLTRDEKKVRKKRLKLCHVTVYFPDHSCLHREVDLTRDTEWVDIDGQSYKVKLPAQPQKGWWPFKPRTLKRLFVPDEHYSLDYAFGCATPLDIAAQIEAAEYRDMTPAKLKAMVPEQMFKESIMSMKKRGKVELNYKVIMIFAGLALVGALVGHFVLGLF